MPTCLSLVFASLLLSLFAAPNPADRRVQLAPGVYVWQGDRSQRKPANLTLVLFNEYALVVDANFPWGAQELLPEIRRTTNKPIRFVFDTHYHGDHAFGNSLFKDAGAMIVLSQATDEELRTKGVKSWNNWRDPVHRLEGARLKPADITFVETMAFDDGAQRVELIRLGPGHSKGDSVAYLPKLGIVMTGDLCVTWAFGNNVGDADANYDGWLRALDRMAGWNVKVVVPGHGTVSDSSALNAQRQYLADMMKQVRDGMQAGKTADELVREVDLSSHGVIAQSKEANAASVRAMVRHFEGRR